MSKTKCPACGKLMLLVNGKRGQMLICPDRVVRAPGAGRARYSYGGFKSSARDSRINQKLISQSYQEAIGSNLGDLLQAALGQGMKMKRGADRVYHHCTNV